METAMDTSKTSSRAGAGTVADFRKHLVREITDKTVADLAKEMNISADGGRKWKLMVERAEKTAARFEHELLPISLVRGPETDDVLRRLLGRKSVAVPILEKKGSL